MMSISSLQQKHAQFSFQTSATRWYAKGGTMSNKKIKNVMPKRNKIQIVQLKKTYGSITMDRVEMRHIVVDYYESLLSTDISSVDVLQMCRKV